MGVWWMCCCTSNAWQRRAGGRAGGALLYQCLSVSSVGSPNDGPALPQEGNARSTFSECWYCSCTGILPVTDTLPATMHKALPGAWSPFTDSLFRFLFPFPFPFPFPFIGLLATITRSGRLWQRLEGLLSSQPADACLQPSPYVVGCGRGTGV